MLNYLFESHSSQETQQLGCYLGASVYRFLSEHPVSNEATMAIALSGDLGAGKTTFTQGVAAGLGVTQQVTSPTFTLVNEYTVPINTSPLDDARLDSEIELAHPANEPITLIHMDSYRLISSGAMDSPNSTANATGNSAGNPSELGGNVSELELLDDVGLDAATFGMEELFEVPRSLVIVEWADRLTSMLPSDHLAIQFRYPADAFEESSLVNYRTAAFHATGPNSKLLLKDLAQAMQSTRA